MLNSFWEGIGVKLADRWMAVLLGPAFVFWSGGLLAWFSRLGWAQFEKQVIQLSELGLMAILVVGILGVASSTAAIQLLVLPVLRVLQGYWWNWLSPLRRLLISWQGSRLSGAEHSWQALDTKGVDVLTRAELEQYAQLDALLRQAPADRDLWMPTRLGNILRAAERRPEEKYGLGVLVCWPRLWLVLPDSARIEISAARSNLDTAVRIAIWGALFLVWSIWSWWAVPAGLLTMIFAYRWALSAAGVYGDLQEAAFDLYRKQLYEAVHWPFPQRTDCEHEQGRQLTEYLFRGTLAHAVTFAP